MAGRWPASYMVVIRIPRSRAGSKLLPTACFEHHADAWLLLRIMLSVMYIVAP